MYWTDVLNNPITGIFIGAFLTYFLTNIYERKKTISTIKIEFLQELIDEISMLDKLSVDINCNMESSIETEEIELDRANIINFINRSNYISRKLEIRMIFFHKRNHLFALIKNYDEARSNFGNYYKGTKIEDLNLDIANEKFKQFYEINRQLQNELTKIMVNVLNLKI